MKTLSQQLLDERAKRKLSRLKAAVEIGVSLPYLQMVEGGVVPAPKTLDKINAWLKKEPKS